ncbi:SWIM zinc finger family protein [Leptolyngbya sp. AN03gr2]|uniref:SWIM zinc finger family protein n=1 Tax=unclassified Leptolyngbya TaxID=2650499 RepID=UPI003D322F04
MSIPPIKLAAIRRNASTQSFTRGESYYRDGAVSAPIQRDNLLQAEVEGSQAIPYQVAIQIDKSGITNAHCTCAYHFEGWCKHIVAVLLLCAHKPEIIEVRPSLEQLLNRLDLNQTRQVLQALLTDHPHLIDDLDRQISLITAVPTPTSPKPARRTPVDPTPFRRQVRQVFRDAVHDWENGYDDDPVTEKLLDIVAKAEEFSQIGDGENAIAILEGITQGCVDDWDEVDAYGADSDGIVAALDRAWTEAILTVELTSKQQAQLRSQFQTWQRQWGQSFSMSLEALQQGWSYPPLLQVLNGEITELGAWDGEPPDFADDLALTRLAILVRQERYQEYLYLAEAEGQTEQFLTMLAQLGRIEESMSAAQDQMTTLEEAFALAQTLHQQGAMDQALEIARTGLTLPGNRLFELATWTSDLAEGQSNLEIAITARVAAFKSRPSFQDYQRIEALTGRDWTALRQDLLQALQNRTAWGMEEAKVDIFLHEGLIDHAITVVTDLSYYHSSLIHRVMDAAMLQHSDWVIENARHRAEEIMDRGKADAYHHAVEWLRKAQAAYQQAGRQPEWSAYYQHLTQTHARKYKLMGLLKKL